ncbi:MAG TPA: 30S ribosomal protein S19e [Methanomassiliicoccaceae archaeon]|jgi:small subunit ribosomal protein S19e|nr:30S ribosomal protein S19e [Euryarchaeota archaeon]HOB37498.1 30S ribosomal protein S19e [Methanomassiliicoccaceae archaeon]HOK28276.1 30S ribosomal protein S19e [Methanomassiliicoccaceae archaeon]HOQ26465.1 30S ribosomal protein S19e [Methanomassiliicoccaceae archaeon]HQD87725.1 30S ribosomal protein S19e [Methanomassiliicoccaceae archaeon]
MVTVYDVPPDKLIAKTAAQLKQMDTIQAPDWAEFVKTGMHTEKAPIQPDWWYIRTASVLRKVFLNGPIGSSRLAAEYGGYADRGVKPNRAVKGSRAIARRCLIQLEKSGLVAKDKKNGRVITPKGQALLDKMSKEVYDELHQ